MPKQHCYGCPVDSVGSCPSSVRREEIFWTGKKVQDVHFIQAVLEFWNANDDFSSVIINTELSGLNALFIHCYKQHLLHSKALGRVPNHQLKKHTCIYPEKAFPGHIDLWKQFTIVIMLDCHWLAANSCFVPQLLWTHKYMADHIKNSAFCKLMWWYILMFHKEPFVGWRRCNFYAYFKRRL